MKRSELLQLKSNLDTMDRDDLERVCDILIDSILDPVKKFKAKGVSKKQERKRNPNSASEKFKRNEKIWPKCTAEKYPRAFLHIVGHYVYAKTLEYGTDKVIDRPIAHYVWACYMGAFPAKGRRLLYMDQNTKNNEFSNLHPQDGRYE